jgi:hypothetical protein
MPKITKKVGGVMDYPFQTEVHDYPIPGKVSVPISADVNTNIVSNKDLYGCGLKEGMWTTNGGIVRGGANKKRQEQKKQKGGDCGCAGTIMQLGGSKQKGQEKKKQQQQKKQKGAGYGYSFEMAHPITNMPEVVRYPTDTAYQNVDTLKGGIVMSGGRKVQNEYLARVSGDKKQQKQQKQQKGGSPASDSLMAYFLDFQSKCRGSQIY